MLNKTLMTMFLLLVSACGSAATEIPADSAPVSPPADARQISDAVIEVPAEAPMSGCAVIYRGEEVLDSCQVMQKGACYRVSDNRGHTVTTSGPMETARAATQKPDEDYTFEGTQCCNGCLVGRPEVNGGRLTCLKIGDYCGDSGSGISLRCQNDPIKVKGKSVWAPHCTIVR